MSCGFIYAKIYVLKVSIRASIIRVASMLNAKVVEKENEKRVVSLQLAWPQKLKNSVRETNRPRINSEDVITI